MLEPFLTVFYIPNMFLFPSLEKSSCFTIIRPWAIRTKYIVDHIGTLFRWDLMFREGNILCSVFNGLVVTLMFCFSKIRRIASVIPLTHGKVTSTWFFIKAFEELSNKFLRRWHESVRSQIS